MRFRHRLREQDEKGSHSRLFVPVLLFLTVLSVAAASAAATDSGGGNTLRAAAGVKAQRHRSRTAFAHLRRAQAVALDTRLFQGQIASPPWSGLRTKGDERVTRYLGSHAAVISRAGKAPAIVESNAPLLVREHGKARPVSLALQSQQGGFSSARPLVPVLYSHRGAEFEQLGVRVSLSGLDPSAAPSLESGRLVFGNATTDTDLWLTPTPGGFRTYAVLRSEASPQRLTFDLDLPDAAKLRPGPGGTAVVAQDGKQILSITAPTAADADGIPVPVSMSVAGDKIVLHAPHRGDDFRYPILVDPEYANDEWDWFEDETPEYEGWTSYTNHSGAFNSAALYLPGRWYGGLYAFTAENTVVNNGDYMEWRLDPPGTTTKVYRTEMEVNTNGLNGCFVIGLSVGQQTTGCGVMNYAYFVRCAVESCDPNAGGTGSYAFYRISSNTTETRTSANKLIGSISYASVRYSDSDLPTFEAVNSGGSSTWVKSFSGEIAGPIRDNGVGMQAQQVTVSESTWTDGYEEPCEGASWDPCPRDMATNYPIEASSIPDGKHKVILQGWDALGQGNTYTWGNVWLDRAGPNVESLSGTLWEKSDKPNAEGKATAEAKALAPGSYTLKIPATDGVAGGKEGEQRSGVKSVEVQVDGETMLAPDSISCPAGSCADTREWTFATAEYPAGTRTITVIAKDQIGNQSSKSFHVVVPPAGELELPLAGTKTSRWVQLKAHADATGYSTVRFQTRKAGGTWANIPLAALSDSTGKALPSIELPITGAASPLVNFEVAKAFSPALTSGINQLQVRAIFSGSTGGGTSKAVPITLDPRGLTTDDARVPIGPGEVNLATGNFSVAATDASISSWATNIAVSRAFNSRDPSANPGGPFGPGWTLSVPVEEAAEYVSLTAATDAYGSEVAELKTTGGQTILFYLEAGKYLPEPGYETMSLTKPSAEEFSLKDDEGIVVTFKKQSGTTGSLYVPTQVQQPGSANTSSVSYEVVGGVPRIATILAPVPAGVSCTNVAIPGCRSLKLVYASSTTATGTTEAEWGNYAGRVQKVELTAYDPATAAMKTDAVSQYLYDSTGRLRAQWDPRISPALKIRYSYNGFGGLGAIYPAGEKNWSIIYGALSGDGDGGRLKSVSRETPQGVATTTIAYQVPMSGSGAPYQMSPEAVQAWGQKDQPVGATAIFPPDAVPSEPPSSWTRAELHYLDFGGREVNTASAGSGIATSEYDVYGNVVRSLSPANRARAVAAGGESVALSEKLDSQFKFENKGTEMVEELGPEHKIKLASGETVRARTRVTVAYDEGAPAGADPHLPTTRTSQAKVTGGATNADARVTKTEYDWTLLKPTKTTRDYGGLNIAESTTYVASTGLPEGVYKPKYPKPSTGSGTPDRKTVYFSAGANAAVPACGNKPAFANLPCKVEPPFGYGDVPVTFFDYNRLNEVTAKTEEVSDRVRTTTTTYDAAGRQLTSRVGSSTDADNLALAYGFEEASGTTVVDKSGNGNTGTLENLAHVTYGRFGRGVEFDSATDKITVPDSASLVPNGAITMEAWLRPDVSGTYQPIFNKPGSTGCSSPSYFLRASASATAPQPEVAGCATYFAAGSTYKLPVGMWSHLAATIDSSKNAKIYVNGELIASGTVTASPGASVGSLVIGSGFDGLIDEVRVYTSALSKAEIHSDMTMAVDGSAVPPSVPVKSGLVGAYGFEELASAGSTLIDSSSLGNNGTYGTLRTGGRFGAAIGSGEATITHSTPLNVGKTSTFEMWLYLTQYPGENRDVLELGSGSGTYKIGIGATGWCYAFEGESLVMTETNYLTLNQPHHLAITNDGTSLKMYIDGVQRATGFSVANVDPKNLKLKPPPSGRLDEVRIYNRALTQTEIKEDSSTPIVLQQSPLTNGTKLPTQTTTYSSTTGRPTTLSTTEEGVTRTITTTYDSVGRPVSYRDADGVTSTTSYDIDDRPIEVSDGKGTQTYGYDATTGLLTSMVDSQAGTFSAEYDATGHLLSQTYPGGMKSHLTYDETEMPEFLSYTQPGCSTCYWYTQEVVRSAVGQWVVNNTNVASHSYTYDGAGRLTLVKETPTGKGCTTREYTYDVDSNRLTKTTREPGAGGICTTTGAGNQQVSTFDAADRITGTGFQYDPWSRLTEIPGSYAGGSPLSMTYYVNDMTRTSSQNGETVGWLLDPTQTRQRATITNETKQTIYHYSDGSDSPSWSANFTGISMTGWQRSVGGVDGSLSALVSNNGATTSVALQLTDLHGDVIGTATTSSAATKPTELFEADEFGTPLGAGRHEYGWLGAKERRTTMASGLVQMGVRSYLPQLGRFTSPDPVYGGSANSYDYASQDPINMFDLDGNAVYCDVIKPAPPFHGVPRSGRGPHQLKAYGHMDCFPLPGWERLQFAKLNVCIQMKDPLALHWVDVPGGCRTTSGTTYGEPTASIGFTTKCPGGLHHYRVRSHGEYWTNRGVHKSKIEISRTVAIKCPYK
jgi:RHS repeat-associated protein